jgi:hypothetical protein
MWSTLRIIVLALWVGAMAAFAFIFAPIAFHNVGPTPAFAATIASCVRNIVAFGDVCAAIAAFITAGFFWRRTVRLADAIVMLCMAIAIGCGTYEVAAIVPRMQATALLTPAYEALHKESSAVYGAAFLSVVAALVLAASTRYVDGVEKSV